MEAHDLIANKEDKKHDHEIHVEELDSKIKELPLKDRVKAIAINHYFQEKQKLDKELDDKIHALQKEYDQTSLPIYAEQKQLILAQRAATQEELSKLNDFFTEEELKEVNTITDEPLTNYWGTVLSNCTALSHVWGDKDKEILKHLTSIDLETSADTEIFTLRFTFSDNEYFKNKELTKKFIIEEGEDFPKSTVGTVIEWNENKDVTVKIVEKKQKNKKTGATRIIKKKQTQLSFFNFFNNSEDTQGHEHHHHDHDHDHDDKNEDHDNETDIDKDYEVGKTIAEEVIPFSLEYFLGINPDEDDFEDCDDEEDDEEGDDDDDEGDDDNDKKAKKNRKKSGDSKKSDKAAKEAKPECKQQ